MQCERGLPLLLNVGSSRGFTLQDEGLVEVDKFEGFFGKGIERLRFLSDRVLEGGKVGGEGGEEVGAFGENGFLRFEFIEELVDPVAIGEC